MKTGSNESDWDTVDSKDNWMVLQIHVRAQGVVDFQVVERTCCFLGQMVESGQFTKMG